MYCNPTHKTAKKSSLRLDSGAVLWYDSKRCRKQKPSVSHPPPQEAVGCSKSKDRQAFGACLYFELTGGWIPPAFLLGKSHGGDNNQQGIACERTDPLPRDPRDR